jgi:hypothetical protein
MHSFTGLSNNTPRAALQMFGMVAALLAAPGHAMDIAPGDYAVAPPGTTLVLYYGQFSSSRALRIDDLGIVDDSNLDMQVNLLRFVRYEERGDLPFCVQAIIPFGSFDRPKIGGVEQQTAEGIGDVILAASIYPVQANGTTVGLSAFLALPTGEYASDALSIGSGTTTATVQLGLIHSLSARVSLDTAIDVAITADHTHAGVKYSQDPQTEAQAYLRLAVTPQTNVSFGYAGFFGGKQHADGVYRGLSAEAHQLRVFADTYITPTVHVQGMIGRDLSRQGGFEADVVGQLRLLKIF